jgi:transposase
MRRIVIDIPKKDLSSKDITENEIQELMQEVSETEKEDNLKPICWCGLPSRFKIKKTGWTMCKVHFKEWQRHTQKLRNRKNKPNNSSNLT